MDMKEILRTLVEKNAVDVFIIAGRPISFKINKQVDSFDEEVLMPEDTQTLVMQLYELARRDTKNLLRNFDDDFSFSLKFSRFRVNAYVQRGSFAAVIRVIAFSLPKASEIGIPEDVLKLGELQGGLVLVTGTSSSGKTTTLTCILDYINNNRTSHIITLEDPIEHLHRHIKSIVSQREISLDTGDYPVALRAALRQSPDVILIGELRDQATINIALTASETGHLVFSALHTLGAANSIDRLVDSFPANQQNQVRMQLSMILRTIVCQQLIPTTDGKIAPVFEIMHCNGAIRTLIREGRTHQINSVIQASGSEGMISMDNSILALYSAGRITKEQAKIHSLTPSYIMHRLGEQQVSNVRSRILYKKNK